MGPRRNLLTMLSRAADLPTVWPASSSPSATQAGGSPACHRNYDVALQLILCKSIYHQPVSMPRLPSCSVVAAKRLAC